MIDFTGQTFGELTAIAFVKNVIYGTSNKKRPRWLFRCTCGNQVERNLYSVSGGYISHCGCKTRAQKAAASEARISLEQQEKIAAAALNRQHIPASMRQLPARTIACKHPSAPPTSRSYLPPSSSSAALL